METLAKLLLAWFGNPPRAMGTAMIAAMIFWGLWGESPGFIALIKDPYLRWPTLVLIISTAGMAGYGVDYVRKRFVAKRQRAAAEKKVIERLGKLTPHEKRVLEQYLQEESTTVTWAHQFARDTDSVLARDILTRDRVLFLLLEANPLQFTPDVYAINEGACEYLHAHPELVESKPEPQAQPEPQPATTLTKPTRAKRTKGKNQPQKGSAS